MRGLAQRSVKRFSGQWDQEREGYAWGLAKSLPQWASTVKPHGTPEREKTAKPGEGCDKG